MSDRSIVFTGIAVIIAFILFMVVCVVVIKKQDDNCDKHGGHIVYHVATKTQSCEGGK